MNGFMLLGAFHAVPATGDGVYSLRTRCAESVADTRISKGKIIFFIIFILVNLNKFLVLVKVLFVMFLPIHEGI